MEGNRRILGSGEELLARGFPRGWRGCSALASHVRLGKTEELNETGK